jgi:hypothetical protein
MTILHGGNICPRRNRGLLAGLRAVTEGKLSNIIPQPEVNGGLRLLKLIKNEWSESRKGGESKGCQWNGKLTFHEDGPKSRSPIHIIKATKNQSVY